MSTSQYTKALAETRGLPWVSFKVIEKLKKGRSVGGQFEVCGPLTPDQVSRIVAILREKKS